MPTLRVRALCCALLVSGCYQQHELVTASSASADGGHVVDGWLPADAAFPEAGRCVHADLTVEVGPETGCTDLALAPAPATADCESAAVRDGSETGRAMRIVRHGRGAVTGRFICQEPGCFEREGFFVGPIVPDRCWSCAGYEASWDEGAMDWEVDLRFGSFQRDGFAEYIVRPHEEMTLRVCFEPYAL